LIADLGHGSRDDASLPVAPDLAPTMELADHGDREPTVVAPREFEVLGWRTVYISALSVVIGAIAAVVAQLFVLLIGLATNLAYYNRFSTAFVSPAGAHRSTIALLLIPVVGGLVVGLMARYGSAAIRGHGIPEVMHRVLYGESRIQARVMILKPTSAAVAIGTGGPFGAEGPIIATGGALGSLIGQIVHVTTAERKTLQPCVRGPARHRAAFVRVPPAVDDSGRARLGRCRERSGSFQRFGSRIPDRKPAAAN
jgi:CIC family chloride channel protein